MQIHRLQPYWRAQDVLRKSYFNLVKCIPNDWRGMAAFIKNLRKNIKTDINNNNLKGLMFMKIQVAPSILSADFAALGDGIRMIEAAGADLVHVDVMDGHFVPNISFGIPVVKCARKATKMPFDVHLMIENPDKYIEAFADAGADIITVHQEACVHLHRTIQMIRKLNLKAAVALNPATPISTLECILPELDMVLLMSVIRASAGNLT